MLQIGANLETRTIRFRLKGSVDTRSRLTSMTTSLGTSLDRLTSLDVIKKLLGGLGSKILLLIDRHWISLIHLVSIPNKKTYIVIIINSHNRSIHTSTSTFDFNKSKKTILGSFTDIDTKMFLDSVENLGRATATQLTRSSSAKLQKVLANRFSIINP